MVFNRFLNTFLVSLIFCALVCINIHWVEHINDQSHDECSICLSTTDTTTFKLTKKCYHVSTFYKFVIENDDVIFYSINSFNYFLRAPPC